MTELLENGFSGNRSVFHKSLNRIIDKYSRLSDIDGGIELDFDDINFSDGRLTQYLMKSKKMLKELEAQSTTHSREESLTAQETTTHSGLDLTRQDEEADQSVSSVGLLSVNENGDSGLDLARLTIFSADEGRGRLSEADLQPEDRDEDLQTTLSSNGNSLWELYPDMMGRVKTAVHKQHVCRVAGGVLRRYHRLRKKPKRSSLNNTVVVSHRPQTERSSERRPGETYGSPVRKRLPRTERSPGMPLGEVSPQEERRSPPRSQHKHILAMSLDCPFLNPKPKENQLNKTITLIGQSPWTRPASCSGHLTVTVDPLRPFKPLSSPVQRAGRSAHAPENSTVDQRSDVHLMRWSPSVGRIEGLHLRRSPQKPPGNHEQYSAGPGRSSSLSPRPSSLSRPLTVRPTKIFSHASRLWSEPRRRSDQSLAARHLSFDSSLQPLPIHLSPQQVDEEYRKVFHKLMCQHEGNGSPASPCSPCLRARTFEVRRGDSSSVLSALALSPHASNQRKRLRERDCFGHREPKSIRREGWMYSDRPSLNRERLRRRLCLAEVEARRHGPPSTTTSRKHEGILGFSGRQSKAHPRPTKTLLWSPPAGSDSEIDDDQDEANWASPPPGEGNGALRGGLFL